MQLGEKWRDLSVPIPPSSRCTATAEELGRGATRDGASGGRCRRAVACGRGAKSFVGLHHRQAMALEGCCSGGRPRRRREGGSDILCVFDVHPVSRTDMGGRAGRFAACPSAGWVSKEAQQHAKRPVTEECALLNNLLLYTPRRWAGSTNEAPRRFLAVVAPLSGRLSAPQSCLPPGIAALSILPSAPLRHPATPPLSTPPLDDSATILS